MTKTPDAADELGRFEEEAYVVKNANRMDQSECCKFCLRGYQKHVAQRLLFLCGGSASTARGVFANYLRTVFPILC